MIEGSELPGRHYVSDGHPLDNVHVGVQVGKQPVGLVRGDAHGKRGERFLYLTWGDVGADGSFAMFRRAKLMVSDIDPELLAATADGTLVAAIGLTDEWGAPRCARVRPPTITWRAG
jgi:Family of unknown function (DUF5990)